MRQEKIVLRTLFMVLLFISTGCVSKAVDSERKPAQEFGGRIGEITGVEMSEAEVLSAVVNPDVVCAKRRDRGESCEHSRRARIELEIQKGCLDEVGPITVAEGFINQRDGQQAVFFAIPVLQNSKNAAAMCDSEQLKTRVVLDVYVSPSAKTIYPVFMNRPAWVVGKP